MRTLAALLVVLVTSCGRASDPPPAPPPAQRLVTLTPSASEIVAALGAEGSLVGVDDYTTFPERAKALPKVGSFLQPNLESIVALRPTLVIVDDVHGQAAGALHDAKIETIECPIHALPDVKAALRSVGARLGRTAEAETAVAAIDAAIEDALAHRPAKRPRVIAVIDREAGGLGNLVAAGPGSWIDELLADAGADNALAGAGARYPKISLEEVLRAQPEIILDLSYAARESTAAWASVDVPATKSGRVRALSEAFLVAPSPRVGPALAAIRAALR